MMPVKQQMPYFRRRARVGAQFGAILRNYFGAIF